MKRALLMMLVTLLAVLPLGHAGILSLSHDELTSNLRVYDGSSGSLAALSSAGLGVQIGSVTADATGDRVFFVTNQDGVQALHAMSYGALSGVESAALPEHVRITHLEWDGSGTPRLVGAGRLSDDGQPTLVRFQGGVLTELGMPQADCCVFRAGVSAFRASDDNLFLVGRIDGENQDRIFRFAMGATITVNSTLLDADLTVLELAVAGNGSLYGVGYSASDDRTRLIAFDAALNATVRGTGVDGCCFVLAGSSVIDPATNDLVVAGTGLASTPEAARLWRFALASGAIVDGVTEARAVGLFHDVTTVVPSGDLFVDGFESGLPLPRASAGIR